ncbi:Flp family type IVb pilin [Brevundimonas lenta]|uniref:Pilus assembly protein Flp/PilA n=1 Tax=Brevundimonas lenta TaxID=424796 RepID=A0A7W6JAU4_9CAUL|nr:Flp family type IVb pilin [Brevundimonas lenta]MBB4081682.1 pilus assembly protein Flp/PilA [Brevundimonas lenta]
MGRFLTRFRDDEDGATAIEYGLIIALIFLAILGSLTAFGDATNGLFQKAMTAINSAMGG